MRWLPRALHSLVYLLTVFFDRLVPFGDRSEDGRSVRIGFFSGLTHGLIHATGGFPAETGAARRTQVEGVSAFTTQRTNEDK